MRTDDAFHAAWELMKSDDDVSVSVGNETIEVSAIIGNDRKRRRYSGYTKEEAVKRFKDEFGLSKSVEKGDNVPTNPGLWSQAKSKARSKFKVYPSAYANGWAAKWYKSKGGGWKKKSKKVKKSDPVEKAWGILKDVATATRSAELWAHNDEGLYRQVIGGIESAVQSGMSREEVHAMLAQDIIPYALMRNEGLAEELSRPDYDGSVDSMNDIDYEEVADGFMDYYDQYLEENA